MHPQRTGQDVTASATSLIRSYGEDAAKVSGEILDRYKRKNDSIGIETWTRICDKIRSLQQ